MARGKTAAEAAPDVEALVAEVAALKAEVAALKKELAKKSAGGTDPRVDKILEALLDYDRHGFSKRLSK